MAGNFRIQALLLSLGGALLLAGVPSCSGDTGPAGKDGPQGDAGPPGSEGPSSISDIEPNLAYLARTTTVHVVGNGTTFKSSSKVDFGSGITVKKTTLASTTSLAVEIEIAKDAKIGTRDVTVDSLKYTGAFDVESPISVSLDGDLQQGGFTTGHVQMLDPSTPFVDPKVTPGDGLTVKATGKASDLGFDVTLFADADAGSSLDLDVQDLVESPGVGVVAVKSRSAKKVGDGDDVSGTISSGTQTDLFEFTSSATAIAQLTLTATMHKGPTFFVLPGGKWADQIKADPQGAMAFTQFFESSSSATAYLVVTDSTGNDPKMPYDYTGTLTKIDTTAASEKEPDDKPAMSTAVATLPAYISGSLSDDMDVDIYGLTLTGAAGKSLRVIQIDDTDTDIKFAIQDSTNMPIGGAHDACPVTDKDGNVTSQCGEDAKAAIAADGAYAIKVSAGSLFAASANKYHLFVTLE